MEPLIVLLVMLFGIFYLLMAVQTFREDLPAYRNLILLLTMALAWLSFTYALELMSTNLAEMMIFTDLEYISYASLPTIFLFFVLSYTGKDHLINRKTVLIASIVPVFVLLSVWTNDLHHLYYTSTYVDLSAQISPFIVSRGPIYIVYAVYTYLILLLAIVLLFRNMKEEPRYRRRQSLTITMACMIPAVGTILQLTGILHLQLGFVVIVCYYICGILFYLGALRTDIYVIVPIASSTIVDNMSDVAIATDLKDRIVRVNPAAERLSTRTGDEIVGKTLEFAYPGVIFSSSRSDQEPLLIRSGGKDHYFHLQTSPLRSRNGTQIGTLYILRDITELEKAREDLKMANTKLNLISNITRHDMLNQLVVVRGFSSLLADPLTRDKSERYLQGIDNAVITMEHLIGFAKDYQKFGLEAPHWSMLESILTKSRMNLNSGRIGITLIDGTTEVYFDQMLERVFYNLFENSLRHGGHVSSITVRTVQEGDDLFIIYEDDGIGVPEEEKAKIFQWGFGKNTGLGLAMCQQILALSGWSIREKGVPGEGAMFEISVPQGDWRRKAS
ncbi:MAG: sensory histidine kinase AtoS [Methanomassiliicoccales archaeon PtaU1.Bin124]|nr:MAG: sensory histidine kinase AtoS [Methanomassiliicoccales archaeon PtaU1.Bin124]